MQQKLICNAFNRTAKKQRLWSAVYTIEHVPVPNILWKTLEWLLNDWVPSSVTWYIVIEEFGLSTETLISDKTADRFCISSVNGIPCCALRGELLSTLSSNASLKSNHSNHYLTPKIHNKITHYFLVAMTDANIFGTISLR